MLRKYLNIPETWFSEPLSYILPLLRLELVNRLYLVNKRGLTTTFTKSSLGCISFNFQKEMSSNFTCRDMMAHKIYLDLNEVSWLSFRNSLVLQRPTQTMTKPKISVWIKHLTNTASRKLTAKTFINVPLVANITPAKRAKNIPTGLACRLMNLSLLVEEFSNIFLRYLVFLPEFVGQDVTYVLK